MKRRPRKKGLIKAVGRLYDKKKKEYCQVCRSAAKQKVEDTNCGNCEYKIPDIGPEIKEYLNCFIQCDSQVPAGVGGIYGLDWNTILKVAIAKGIEINNKFLGC